MPPTEPEQRLSRISTRWTMVFQAHAAAAEHPSARWALLQRYHAVVYRYLLGAVRDPECAEELCQEFALRLVRGDFRRADPERGRFRDYLKKSLIHLVTDHFRQRQDWPRQMADDAPEPAAALAGSDSERDYLRDWRDEILKRTWQSLAEHNAAYYQVLHFRIDHPDLSSAQAAEQLSSRLGKPVTGDWVRQTAGRAQKRFAELLIEEVGGLLEKPSAQELEDELRDLDLLRFCGSALQRPGQG